MKFSEMNSYQKLLFVISWIDIVFAIVLVILGIALFAGASSIIGELEATAPGQYTQSQIQISGVSLIVGGALSILVSLLGVRASKNVSKIKPVFYIATVLFVFTIASVLHGLISPNASQTTNLMSNLTSLLTNGLLFYASYNLFKQVRANNPQA